MGKRPSLKQLNPDDRFKNDDDDDDEDLELENQTEEPLRPDELNKIQSRKKLIAKRRVNDSAPAAPTGFSFAGFGAAKPAGTTTTTSIFNGSAAAASNGSEASEKPPVFTGFKGFSSFAPPPAAAASSNGTAAATMTSTTASAVSSLFKSGGEAPKTTTSTMPSLLAASQTSSAVTVAESSTLKEKTNGNEVQAYKNITETELSFINGLEELYKRCYMTTAKSRHYKLPVEVLNNSNIDSLGSEDDLKAKYAYLLAELNRNTSKWISKHVEESPLVILTPIFVDYFNYLILLEKQFFPEIFKGGKQDASSSTGAASMPSMPFSLGGSAAGDSRRGFEEKENNHGKPATTSFKLNGSGEHGSFGAGSQAAQTSAPSALFFGKSNLGNADNKPAAASSIQPPLVHLNGHNKSVSVSSTSSSMTSGTTMKIGDDDDEEDEDDDDDVQEIASDDAKLAESSKTFAALIKSSSTSSADSSKPLFGSSSGSDSTFGFKPLEAKETPAAASPFKFGSTTTTTTTTASTTGETFSLAQSTKLSFLAKQPSSETPALFTFGAKKDDKSDEAPAKPAAAVATSASGFFSAFASANKEKEDESSSASTFKPFSGFGAASTAPSSLFGSLSKPQQATSETPAAATAPSASAAGASKPFFSFQSIATNKVEPGKPAATSSVFGNLPAPGSGGSIFGNLAAGGTSSIFAAAAANPLGGGGGGGEGGEADDEPYEPPKPETSDVQEEGAVFTKRVKLFYFNGEKFCDRGIGNLYLKPTSNGEKTQLIVRADTKLATILLNINLAKSLPTSKMGAKDVSLLCVPNPPVQDPKVEGSKPCKFLFKVKTEQDADELVAKLSELKK